MMLNTFSHVYWPFMCLLWRKVYSNPWLIFKLGCLSFYLTVNLLYILDIRPLSDVLFTNTVSNSEGCLFTFLIVYFNTSKVLILMKFNFSIFLWLLCLGVISEKCLLIKVTKTHSAIFF